MGITAQIGSFNSTRELLPSDAYTLYQLTRLSQDRFDELLAEGCIHPGMSDEALEELAADIKANGQKLPIQIDASGILFDGRNRLEACKRAGVEPRIETSKRQPTPRVLSLRSTPSGAISPPAPERWRRRGRGRGRLRMGAC
jgi:hypothetical protein